MYRRIMCFYICLVLIYAHRTMNVKIMSICIVSGQLLHISKVGLHAICKCAEWEVASACT